MAGLSQKDRDSLIRTIIGEAGGEGPDGQAAVAHVILNRMAKGGYGDNVTQIVTAPNQFEPWNTPDGLRRMDVAPDAPAYQNAAGVVDSVLSGAAPDPTGGATHFFAPKAQAALGRQPPAWAKDPIAQIGGHVFFAPNGPADATDAIRQAAPSVSVADALGYTGQQPTAKSAPSMTDDFDKRWGIGQASSEPAAAAPDDFDKRWGISASAPLKGQPTTTGGGANEVLNAATGGMIEGVPIVGPAIKAGAQKTAAAIRSVLNDSKYGDELKFVQDATKKIAEDHPYVHTGGEIAGAVAGMAPLGATAVGSRMLGLTGPTLASRMIYGGVGNSLVGAADATARGDNPFIGAGFGALGGGAGPLVGQLAGAGVNKLTGAVQGMLPTRVPGMSRSSANMLGTLVAADDPTAIRSFLNQHGDLAMMADAGPSLTGAARALTGKPGEAKSVITRAYEDRAAGTTNRLMGDVNGALGPAPTPSRIEAGLDAAREAVGPEYDAVMRGASAVNTEPLANALDASVANLRGPAQRAVRDVRGYLNVPGTDHLDPNPQALLSTRQAIDGLLRNEENPQVVRQLTIARQSVDRELTNAVPGVKDVDAKYQELQRQSGGLVQGGQVLDSGKQAIRPQELAESFRADANPAGTLVGPSATPMRVQQGARAEIDRLVGTNSNDLRKLTTMLQGEGGWNTNKLATVFGEEPTNRLLGAVNREATFSGKARTVIGGSDTQRGQAAEKMFEETAPGSTWVGNMSGPGMIAQMAKSAIVDPIMRMIMESPNAPRNLEIARAMTAQGANRFQILDAILRLNQRQGIVSNTGNSLSNAISGGTNRLMLGAGATMRP